MGHWDSECWSGDQWPVKISLHSSAPCSVGKPNLAIYASALSYTQHEVVPKTAGWYTEINHLCKTPTVGYFSIRSPDESHPHGACSPTMCKAPPPPTQTSVSIPHFPMFPKKSTWKVLLNSHPTFPLLILKPFCEWLWLWDRQSSVRGNGTRNWNWACIPG